jgi:hypothetical protein
VLGQRAWSGTGRFLIEPVATLVPGWHLVSKLGGWASARSLGRIPGADLAQVDPDVYTRYDGAHTRGLYLEEGLETEPLANVVFYGNARLTTNPSLWFFDQDHVSVTALARAALGRLYTEVGFRATWFFVDADRPDPARVTTVLASVFHTFWIGERQRIELGVFSAIHLDARAPEALFYLAWEGSHGRRFRDHTPLEGEDYFFPQRSPEHAGVRLVVPPR